MDFIKKFFTVQRITIAGVSLVGFALYYYKFYRLSGHKYKITISDEPVIRIGLASNSPHKIQATQQIFQEILADRDIFVVSTLEICSIDNVMDIRKSSK
jgi:hypothetical protein